MTVLVYNYAAVSFEVLAQAEEVSKRIYEESGIDLVWLDCPLSPNQTAQYPACEVPPDPTTLAIRVLPRAMAERYRQPEDTFGFALFPEDGTFAQVANVFSHEAEALAKRRHMSNGVILGHLMAHELGHLLLGVRRHSANGIMHVPWHIKELEIISQRLMLFEQSQGERMRTNIRVRLAAGGAAR